MDATATTDSVTYEKRNTQAVKLIMPFEIEENLEDAVVMEGSTAELECKVNAYQSTTVWYKDGSQIKPSDRIKAVTDRKWRRLEIENVTEEDSGLYSVLIRNSYGALYSKANLQIGSKKYPSIYTCPSPRQGLSVVKQLSNVVINSGERIELEVEINSDVLEFQWFKGDTEIKQNERTIILNSANSSVISIHCAKVTDTGVYTVVAKTKFGVTSSTTHVEVIDMDLKSYHNEMPIIEEVLPDKVDVNEFEEARLICKVRYDSNTVIKWFKNDVLIECNETLITEEYSGEYIGLRILNATPSDSAEYSVILKNMLSGHSDSSASFVTVTHSPMLSPPLVLLQRPLVSCVACCGSSVTYDCSFELVDTRLYYVVWFVGHFRIERSNSRFDVVCHDGEFLLHIKKLEPSMSGEVVCELRKALPSKRSIFVSSASAHLAVVPPSVLEDVKKMYPGSKPPHHIRFQDPDLGVLASGTTHLNGSNTNGHENGEKCSPDDFLMQIKYCRLENDNFYYLDVLRSELMASVQVTVKNKESDVTRNSQVKTVLVEWPDPHLQTWYAIDLKNQEFLEVGVSSYPSFEIHDPLVGKPLEFRIRAAVPMDGRLSEVQISIAPTSPAAKVRTLKEMASFDSCFLNTGHVIGSGAFGSVVLVLDKSPPQQFYAAKFLKTRIQKKRERAQREYDIMKELNHAKVVELIDAFVADGSFVFVMDFLWGGELFDRIVEEEHIKESDVVPYVRQICEALQYLHRLKIAHLDLKPENIICLSPNSTQIKIVDFGIARVLEEGHVTRIMYGTRDYVAPEVLNFEQVTFASDMWSMGVVTYMLLSGVMPFAGDTWPARSANITRANYNYDETAFKDISDLAKDFVDHLLILGAEKRMTAADSLNHRWIVDGPPKGAKAGHMRRARENLKSYLANYRARWQRAGNVMIAAHRLRTQASNRSSLERASPDTDT
ncbi:titin [Amyelois transitella]|uniref:titin n=1 Tax=Amyelois transitella TaxID=680683 RepID=UPI0029906468|nr:titin [Amyelois transitella]